MGADEREQRAGPGRGEVRYEGAPAVPAVGRIAHVVLAGPVIDGEAPGDRLLVERVGGLRGRGLVVLAAGLGPDHVLEAHEGQALALLRGLEEHRGTQGALGPRGVADDDGAHAVPVDVGAHELVLEEQAQAPSGHVGSQQLVEGREAREGVAAQLGHEAPAGVEPRILASSRREPAVVAVVGADPLAQLAVGAVRAPGLDPGVLVGGDRLAGQLATEPQVGLHEEHGAPSPAGGQRRRAAAQAAAEDDHVRLELLLRPAGAPARRGQDRQGRGRGQAPAGRPAEQVASPGVHAAQGTARGSGLAGALLRPGNPRVLARFGWNPSARGGRGRQEVLRRAARAGRGRGRP